MKQSSVQHTLATHQETLFQSPIKQILIFFHIEEAQKLLLRVSLEASLCPQGSQLLCFCSAMLLYEAFILNIGTWYCRRCFLLLPWPHPLTPHTDCLGIPGMKKGQRMWQNDVPTILHPFKEISWNPFSEILLVRNLIGQTQKPWRYNCLFLFLTKSGFCWQKKKKRKKNRHWLV